MAESIRSTESVTLASSVLSGSRASTTPPSQAEGRGRLHVEDMSEGQVWYSPYREITADDVREFALLTGDDDPLHRMESAGVGKSRSSAGASAERSPFGRPVAHGLLGLSVLAGLGTAYPNAATLALVGIADWQFDNPVYFGDSVRVETTLESIEPHGRRAGRATWMRRLIAADGRQLQHGRFITLVAMRGTNPRRPR